MECFEKLHKARTPCTMTLPRANDIIPTGSCFKYNNSNNLCTLAKIEMIYPKNMDALVAMSLT